MRKKLANLKSDPSIPIFPSEKGRLLDPKENLKWDLKSIAMKLIEQDPDHESHRADNQSRGIRSNRMGVRPIPSTWMGPKPI